MLTLAFYQFLVSYLILDINWWSLYPAFIDFFYWLNCNCLKLGGFCFVFWWGTFQQRGTIQAFLWALLLVFCAIERIQERSRGKHPWEGSQWNGRHTGYAKSKECHPDPQRGGHPADCMRRINWISSPS